MQPFPHPFVLIPIASSTSCTCSAALAATGDVKWESFPFFCSCKSFVAETRQSNFFKQIRSAIRHLNDPNFYYLKKKSG